MSERRRGCLLASRRPGVPTAPKSPMLFGAKLPPIPNVAPPPAWPDTTSIPTVPLNHDPADGYSSLDGLYDALSDEEEALLGCGAFWGTDCSVDGIDLRRADASVILRSFYAEGDYGIRERSLRVGLVLWRLHRTQGHAWGWQPFLVGLSSGGFGRQRGFPKRDGRDFVQPPDAARRILEDAARGSREQPAIRRAESRGSVQPRARPMLLRTAPVLRFGRSSSTLSPPSASQRRRSGDTQPHWIWEAGAEYQIVGAVRRPRGLRRAGAHTCSASKVAHARGENRRADRAVPRAGQHARAGNALCASAPGVASGASFGLAYLTAPEPSDVALAIASLAALATLDRAAAAPLS